MGYDSIGDVFYCGATAHLEVIEPEWAEDDDLGCDLFVDNRNDDTTKKP